MNEVRINDSNNLSEATVLLHWLTLALCWMVDINIFWSLAMSAIILLSLWRIHNDSTSDLRCLWLGPGNRVRADIGGDLCVVKYVATLASFNSYTEFVLHCANGERVKARVFKWGVDTPEIFHNLCRRLNVGTAW